MKEVERIENNTDGEKCEGLVLQFRVRTSEPLVRLSKVKEVVLRVASYNGENWPSDREWEDILPKWFTVRIKSYSINEILKHSTVLWDYGSWLDAMRNRGWEWYSSQVLDDGFLIFLKAKDFPYAVNPLEYIIYESGVLLSDIQFIEGGSV